MSSLSDRCVLYLSHLLFMMLMHCLDCLVLVARRLCVKHPTSEIASWSAFQNLMHLTSTHPASSVLAHLPFSTSVSGCSVDSAVHCLQSFVMCGSDVTYLTVALDDMSPFAAAQSVFNSISSPHASILGIFVGRLPYFSAMASWKGLLCKAKSYSSTARVLS